MKRLPIVVSSLSLSWVVAVASSGCSEGPAFSVDAIGPFSLNGSLVYVDRNQAAAVIVDPRAKAGAAANAELVRVAVGDTPTAAMSAPHPAGGEQVLVLDPGGQQVFAIADATGTARAIDIGLPLGALDVSTDGRFGLAYQPEDSAPSRALFAFPNSVAVVDFRDDAGSARAMRLGAASARPVRAVFSRSLRLADPLDPSIVHDIAAALVFVQGGVVPLQLDDAAPGELVSLTTDASRRIYPAEVLFTNNEGDDALGRVDGVERAFVRSSDNELFVLALSIHPGNGRLDVALENVVTPETPIFDIELFFDAAGRSLLLAAAKDEVVIVDGYTGVARRFDAPSPVDRLVRYTDPDTTAPMAIGLYTATPTMRLLRLDPQALMLRRASGVEIVSLGVAVENVRLEPGAARAVVTYRDAQELGVLELRRGGQVLDVRFANTPQASALVSQERLLVVSNSPEDREPYLAEVGLGSLQSRDVRLPATASAVGNAGDDFYWIAHPDNAGSVSFVPKDDMDRRAIRNFRGILLAGLLDDTPPAEVLDDDDENYADLQEENR